MQRIYLAVSIRHLEGIEMIARSSRIAVAMLTLAIALLGAPRAFADQPIRFTFTPTFKDPDPGKRHWEQKGTGYVETLPSGRVNTFRFNKAGKVHGLRGIILQKVEEPNFFVFIADSKAARPELWWWRNKAPWNFMGYMREVIVPGRFD
jgi:hypothetical protein